MLRLLPAFKKINKVLTDNAEDLDIVMSVYNLIECSKKYRKTVCSLWNYHEDKTADPIRDSGS